MDRYIELINITDNNITDIIKTNNNKINVFDTKMKHLYNKIEEINLEIIDCKDNIIDLGNVNAELETINKIICSTRDLKLYVDDMNYGKILDTLNINKQIINKVRDTYRSSKISQICNSYVYQETKIIDIATSKYNDMCNKYIETINCGPYNFGQDDLKILEIIKYFGENIFFDNITKYHLDTINNIFINVTNLNEFIDGLNKYFQYNDKIILLLPFYKDTLHQSNPNLKINVDNAIKNIVVNILTKYNLTIKENIEKIILIAKIISKYDKNTGNNLSHIIDNYLDCYIQYENNELTIKKKSLQESIDIKSDIIIFLQYISNIVVNCSKLSNRKPLWLLHEKIIGYINNLLVDFTNKYELLIKKKSASIDNLRKQLIDLQNIIVIINDYVYKYEDKLKECIYDIKKDCVNMDNQKKMCNKLIDDINNIGIELLMITLMPKTNVLSSYYSKLNEQTEKSDHITKMNNILSNVLPIYINNMDKDIMINFIRTLFYQLVSQHKTILYNCNGLNNNGINQILIDVTYIEEYIGCTFKNLNKKIPKIIINELTEIKNIIKVLRIDDVQYGEEIFAKLFPNNSGYQKILDIKLNNKSNNFLFFKK